MPSALLDSASDLYRIAQNVLFATRLSQRFTMHPTSHIVFRERYPFRMPSAAHSGVRRSTRSREWRTLWTGVAAEVEDVSKQRT